jgi:hypothetical protein
MKGVQQADYLAQNLISPYGTFAPTLEPGSSRGSFMHELLQQLTSTKVPTAAQRSGTADGPAIRYYTRQKTSRPPGVWCAASAEFQGCAGALVTPGP